MKTNFIIKSLLVASSIALASSCSSDEPSKEQPKPIVPPTASEIGADVSRAGGFESKDGQPLVLGYAVGYSDSKQSFYIQSVKENVLSNPNTTIDWNGKGFPLVENERAPHAYHASNGNIYSLAYRVGDISEIKHNATSGAFQKGKEVRSQVLIGNNNMRFTLLNKDLGSVHEISASTVTEAGNVVAASSKYNIVLLDLATMTLGTLRSGEIRMPNGLDKEGYHISRIHTPVITGGKIYYGVTVSKFKSLNGGLERSNIASTQKTATLMFDYPSFANPQVLVNDKDLGATVGYRSRNMFLAEDGRTIYQLTGFSGKNAHILSIRDGKYVNSDGINLGSKLGIDGNISTVGWTYAGNGVAFVPYSDGTKESMSIGTDPQGNKTQSAPWGIARVNLLSGEVLKLNVPSGTYLFQFQEAAVRGGKVYYAISPVTPGLSDYTGRIYIWDVAQTKSEPTLGARLISSARDIYSAVF